MKQDQSPATTIEALRARGWAVAVHNDYRLNGQPHTFWLLTHPSGRWVKGEGHTDSEALAECDRQIERNSLEKPPQPFAVRCDDGWLSLGFDSYDQAQKFWKWAERLQHG